MKKLLILSGKGGTGKTTLAGAFVRLGRVGAFADCDVDAPNLHLLYLDLPTPKTSDYYGMGVPEIDTAICNGCGICEAHCRFHAIEVQKGYAYCDSFACEGCGLCEYVCPQHAIKMMPNVAGRMMLFTSTKEEVFGPEGKISNSHSNDALVIMENVAARSRVVFSSAELKMGSGTSGKLVSEVKKNLNDSADEKETLAIIDGSPGIGCPVIASITGTDMVLILAEPSISGISDMQRLVETAAFFGVQIAICVNKADTNLERTEDVKVFADLNNIPFLGCIPYDENVLVATNSGKSIVDLGGPAADAITTIFSQVKEYL